MQDIKGKVVFITGGNKGIGYGIAESCLAAGMKVAISSRSAHDAEKAARALSENSGGEALGLGVDVRNYQDLVEANDKIITHFGQLDVLIANAGIGHFAAVDEMDPADWQRVMDTNVNGVFHSVRACVEELKKTEGYVFTISSLAGTNFFAKGSAYNASKFAVTGMSQAMMLDLRPYNIRVSTIMPGSVTSYFNGHEPNENDAWKIQPEDIGEIIIDLLQVHPRSLPSKVEIRPSRPPGS